MRETIIHNGDVFEIVEEFPLGYEIWNIGENMLDGYLPLCRLSSKQPFDGGRCIETDTLKAIRCDGAQIILDAVHGGTDTLESMERYVKRHQRAKPGSYAYEKVQKIQKALPFMYQIKWPSPIKTRKDKEK